MLTCMLLEVLRLNRVWNAGMWEDVTQKAAYAIFKICEVRISILMHDIVHS